MNFKSLHTYNFSSDYARLIYTPENRIIKEILKVLLLIS